MKSYGVFVKPEDIQQPVGKQLIKQQFFLCPRERIDNG